MRYCIILFLLLIKSLNVYSQIGWEPWEVIYSDSTVAVEVQFRLSQNSCEMDGKKFKFRTRIKGELKTYEFFVNWKMDYTDCNGNQFYQQNSIPIWKDGGGTSNEIPIESIDDIFTANSLDKMHYDEEASNYSKSGSGRKGVFRSIDPKGIIGKNRMNFGESIILSVNGGTLGEGAEWIWYKDTCGTIRIGNGPSLKIQPETTTTYFVRAEGRDNITNCVELTVIVNPNSKAPESIILKSSPCKGVPNTLKVSGGYLGLEAAWKWYEDSCNGNFIGTGNFITINPEQKTTYFVRAEGKTNTTECASLMVDPLDKSSDPVSSILSKANAVCEGDTIELSISDNTLSPDAHWSWYAGDCGGISLADGPMLRVKADSTTVFYVRGEGQCGNTKCVFIQIDVNNKSIAPSKINTFPAIGKIYKGKNTVLTLEDGNLGTNADWNWYKGSCGNEKFIAQGPSLNIHPRKKTNYFVKAVGPCNTTDCKSILISPITYHYFSRRYSDSLKHRYHYGISLGLENFEFPNMMSFTEEDTSGNLLKSDSLVGYVNGLGIKAALMIHPIIKKHFSVGFFGSYAQGTTTLIVNGYKSVDFFSTSNFQYDYTRINFGTEIAFGLKKLKLLFILNRSTQSNDFHKTKTFDKTIEEYYFKGDINNEALSFGLRLGSYSGKKDRRPRTFDILYNLNRSISDKLFKFEGYNDLSEWNVGTGLKYWVQSKLKIQADITLKTKHKDLSEVDFKNMNYLVSLNFNLDWFQKYKK